MAIPNYQAIMLPLLKLAADRQEHTLKAIVATLAAQFDLTDEERQTLRSSGQQTVFANRVAWAQTYLKKAGLLESPRRGVFQSRPVALTFSSNPPPASTITTCRDSLNSQTSSRYARQKRPSQVRACHPHHRSARRKRNSKMPIGASEAALLPIYWRRCVNAPRSGLNGSSWICL